MGVISWTWAEYKRRRFGGVLLGPVEAEMLSLFVMRPSWDREDLAEAIYGDDPDGGPLTRYNTVAVTVNHINRKIAPYRIACPHGANRGMLEITLREPIDIVEMRRAA